MKKIVLVVSFVIASVVNVFGQENDTTFIDTNSIEYKALYMEVSQLMANLIEPRGFLDHTHLRDNMMQILLSNDPTRQVGSNKAGQDTGDDVSDFRFATDQDIERDRLIKEMNSDTAERVAVDDGYVNVEDI